MILNPWDPEKWGPVAWRVLHSLALVTTPLSMQRVLDTLVTAVPCPTCSQHMSVYLSTHRMTRDVPRYLFDFHNTVNARNSKPVLTRLPAYHVPHTSHTFCADLTQLIRLMQSKRTPQQVRPFALAVDQALFPFSCK